MSLRLAIIGNSGSGKSYLARRMAGSLGVRAIELDSIFWLPGASTRSARPRTLIG
jgi:adenylate kinase family enzyme